MKLNLKEPFVCDKLLAAVISDLYPNETFDFSLGGEANQLSANDEITEDHLGGNGSFDHFRIQHGQMLFTYGYDLPEMDLQAFLIANTEMNEVYCICFLDSDGNVYKTVRDFDIGLL